MLKIAAPVLLLIVSVSAGYSYSASIVSAGRVILDTTPLSKAASKVYAKITNIIEPVRIKFPEKQSVDALKSSIREGVTATTSAAARADASEKYNLSVETNVQDPSIKIMNIGPKYRDGMALEPGNYEIFIEKPGYRSKRFWVNLEDKSNQSNDVILKANLDPLGLPNCTDRVQVENYAGALDTKGGNIVQIQADFPNVNINDLYLSFAKEINDSNFQEVIDTIAYPDYVEFQIASPTTLSEDDIKNNRVIEIDEDRFIMSRVIFEQVSSNVLFTYQQFMPPLVMISDMSKEVLCEHTFTF